MTRRKAVTMDELRGLARLVYPYATVEVFRFDNVLKGWRACAVTNSIVFARVDSGSAARSRRALAAALKELAK